MSAEPLPWRLATPGDATTLRDLERRASLAGLGHVFGSQPYPDDDVLERWRGLLGEAGVVTEVVDGSHGLVALLCGDTGRDGVGRLRHLAVEPATWGRGLGEAAVARFRERVPGAARLWCLERNRRALALYGRLGWSPTGRSRRTPWPPEPVEVELGVGALPSARGR